MNNDSPFTRDLFFGVTMLYRIARAGIFKLDAEKAHDLAIQNFKKSIMGNDRLISEEYINMIITDIKEKANVL